MNRARSILPLVVALAGCPSAAPEAPDTGPKPAPTPTPLAPKKDEPPPMHEATRKEAEDALAMLEKFVKTGATDPKNAWAMAHGIVAFGKDLKLADGRTAVEAITGDYAFVDPKTKRVKFDRESKDEIPVEPHKDLLIKTMLESGVPKDAKLKTRDKQTVTLERMTRDAEASFSVPSTDSGWHDFAWSAYAFMLAHGKEPQIKTSSGAMTMAQLAETTMARLEIEQGFLEQLMMQGRPEAVEKRKQGIYGHHCGGLHFVQAAVLAAATTKDEQMIARARRQLAIVAFRWEAERRIYEAALKDQPKYKWLLLVQELKFFGHVLETFALARDYGILPKDPETERKLRLVTGDLVNVVARLEPAYQNIENIGASVPQTKYDLIGDGCHAIRGLRRGLVAFFAPQP